MLAFSQPNYILRQARENEAGLISYLRLASLLCLEMPGQSLAAIRTFMTVLPDADAPLLADGSYFVADKDGDLIGGGGWSVLPLRFRGGALLDEAGRPAEISMDRDSILIRGFFLDTDMVRRGVGARLLGQIEESALRAGYSESAIVVPASAQLHYRSLGFKSVVKLALKLREGSVLPLLQMRKSLTSRLCMAA